MAIRDLIHSFKGTAGVAPAVKTATALSSTCDLQGFQSAMAQIHVGVYGDSQSGSVFIEAELQESDDDSTYTACADAVLDFPGTKVARTGTATGTFFQSKTTGSSDAAGLYHVGYRGGKRYLKVNVRLTGTHTNGTPVAVSFVRASPDVLPAQ